MAVRQVIWQGETFNLHYEILHPEQSETILFLHGWGSNKEIMKQAFGSSCSQYKHIYLDMPGFGKSSNPIVLDTPAYRQIVRLFLDDLDLQPAIIMGHSFGGKVATLLSPPKLVLLSSAGIIEPKPWNVRLKITLAKWLKPIFGPLSRSYFMTEDAKGMSNNMYETLKNVVDEDFSGNFAAHTQPTDIFWGENDTATRLESGRKIAELMPDSHFFPLAGDHYFFLTQGQLICRQIEEGLKK